MGRFIHARILAATLGVGLTGCGAGGGGTGATAGDTEGASTGGPTTGDPTTDGPTTGGPGTGEASTGGGGTSGGGGSTGGDTGGGTDGTTGGGGTGEASTGGGSTGEASTGGTTGGVVPFSHFACTETTPVELLLKETISGAFDAQGVPLDVTAVMVKSGAIDFHVDVAGEVAPDDPYAADVAFWEQSLTAKGWDVNTPGDMSGDRRYIFIPDGAQFVAKFSLFYYRVYEGGGNGQFEFECLKQ